MACICKPVTDQERHDLEHYGCPEEICPGCYAHKRHNDSYCPDCQGFLDQKPEEEVFTEVEPDSYPKMLYLMQGVPGSGKSTIANMIAFSEREHGKTVARLSTDDWRFDDEGTYVFDPKDNVRYHKACQQECARVMAEEVDVVIIDNTNIQEWQAHPYIVMAEIWGYHVEVISVDCGLAASIARQLPRRPDRQVPDHVIIRMYNEMERLLAQPAFFPQEDTDGNSANPV